MKISNHLRVFPASCVLGSVLTLTVLSLERVYAIVLPLRAMRLPCRRRLTLIAIWVLAILGGAPLAVLKQYQVDTVSTETVSGRYGQY